MWLYVLVDLRKKNMNLNHSAISSDGQITAYKFPQSTSIPIFFLFTRKVITNIHLFLWYFFLFPQKSTRLWACIFRRIPLWSGRQFLAESQGHLMVPSSSPRWLPTPLILGHIHHSGGGRSGRDSTALEALMNQVQSLWPTSISQQQVQQMYASKLPSSARCRCYAGETSSVIRPLNIAGTYLHNPALALDGSLWCIHLLHLLLWRCLVGHKPLNLVHQGL